MTMSELINNILSVDGTRVMFKRIEEDIVLIFWVGHSPIASVFTRDNKYNIGYSKLYDLDFEDIKHIDSCLEAFVNTDLLARELKL